MNTIIKKGHCKNGPSIAVVAYYKQGKIDNIALASHEEKGLKWQVEGGDDKIESFVSWIQAYANREEMSWIDPLPLPDTPFARLVEASLRSLKFGTVASYRAIAEKIGCPQGARAVGNACGSNRFPLIVPCHRVITSTGQLGGFSQSLLVKKRLLEFETQRDW